MSEQWGASAPQPDGSWPPQPAPSYPSGPPQQYPQQPPAPPAPAGPYAADPYSGPYSGQYSGQYPAQHAGQYAPQQPASGLDWGPSQPQHIPQHAPQHAQVPPQQPQPQPASPPEPQYQNHQSASLYTSVPPPPSTLPPEDSYPYPPPPPSAQPAPYAQAASYSQPAAYPQPVPYPQAPGGPPIEASVGASTRPTNPFAVIGAVMSFFPVVGLVFSIIGLGKAKLIGGIGRGVATLGVVLSLIFIPGWCVAGYFAYRAVNATAADPACVAAEGDYLTYSRTLDSDAAAMAKTTYGTRQFTNAVKTYESDFQVLIGKLQVDSDRAENADVHTAIVSLIADLQQLKTVMGDLASGDFSAAGRLGDVSTLTGKLFDDYEQTQSVCQSHTSG